VTRWLFSPVPKARIAAYRTLVYLFLPLDLMFFSTWIRSHGSLPGNLYQPLIVGRLLHLPTPTHLIVEAIYYALIPLSLLAATGRAPRLLGWTVFALYLEWMIIAMSYGKVDHDRYAILVALAALPTAGRARHGDQTPTEAGGFALRATQLGVIATYFLASIAKLRFGGLPWLTGATLTRAFIRRGTPLAQWLLKIPGFTTVSQFGIVGFELFSPIVFFVKPRWRYYVVAGFYLFHLFTISLITISFIPHQIAMTAFLPLEKVTPLRWLRRLRRGGSGGDTPDATGATPPAPPATTPTTTATAGTNAAEA
jgi:hypothetical protein